MKTGPHWASHASELAWVWGYEPACYRNASEIALTTTMQNFWGSFTREGSMTSWAAWTEERGNTMVLDIGGCAEVAQLKTKDCAQLLAVNASFWPTGGG
jgi:carboxylesterase type B